MKVLIKILELISLIGRIASIVAPLALISRYLIILIFILFGQNSFPLPIIFFFIFLGIIWLGFTLFVQSAFITFMNPGGFSFRVYAVFPGVLAGLLLVLMMVNFSGWGNLIQSLQLALFLGLVGAAFLFGYQVPQKIMGSFAKKK